MINVLLTGYRSEMVLNNLAFKLKSYDCINVFVEDFEKPIDIKFYKKLENLVFLTSQHISIDSDSYKRFYSHAKHYISPIELILILNPIKKFYFPHDWATPLELGDVFFLHYFNYIVFDRPLDYSELPCTVLDLGNVKFIDNTRIGEKDFKGVYFVNNYKEFRRKFENRDFFFRIFLLILRFKKIAIKFHNERELDDLEISLRCLKNIVIDKNISVIEILENFDGVFITDSYGSIMKEMKDLGVRVFVTKIIKPDSFHLQHEYMNKYELFYLNHIRFFSRKYNSINRQPVQRFRVEELMEKIVNWK